MSIKRESHQPAVHFEFVIMNHSHMITDQKLKNLEELANLLRKKALTECTIHIISPSKDATVNLRKKMKHKQVVTRDIDFKFVHLDEEKIGFITNGNNDLKSKLLGMFKM